jgi:tetratricopeptide (TPR) repeat protein
VDSIVVLPYVLAEGLKTPLNSTQVKLFQELLIAQLELNPNLRVFEEPPTKLPNTLIIEGRLTKFEVEDLPGTEFFLRAIHMTVEWRFRTGEQTSTSRLVRRQLSFQKIYPPDIAVPTLDFDLHNAVNEITVQLGEVMYPTPLEGRIPIADASDPVTREELGHPLLLRGNKMAAKGRFDKAKRLWRLVLFNPVLPEEEELFRISQRTLLLLQNQGVEDDIIRRLRPLMREDPEDLLEFRSLVRRALGGFHQIEPTLLKLADHHRDTRHLNMAAAHRNLAVLYWIESRNDLATYHLARAQANYAREEYMEKWAKLQESRDAVPVELTVEEAIGFYMRIPSPRSAWVAPGTAENSLFPPVVFEASVSPTPAGGEERPDAPVETSQEEAPLKPVQLAPPSGPEGADSPGLPPVQTPVPAGG